MSAPELFHSDSTSSTGSDAMRTDDLPAGVIERGLDEMVDASIAGIINAEVGHLGAPGLISEGTGPGEASPSSDSESDKRSLTTRETAPMLQLNAISDLLDGESPASTEISAISPPKFIPRGPVKPPSAVEKHKEPDIKTENERTKKEKQQDKKAKDKKTKDLEKK